MGCLSKKLPPVYANSDSACDGYASDFGATDLKNQDLAFTGQIWSIDSFIILSQKVDG